MLSLPSYSLSPSKLHVQVDLSDFILSCVRPLSLSLSSLIMPELLEVQHVDSLIEESIKKSYVDQLSEVYVSQHAEVASSMLSCV